MAEEIYRAAHNWDTGILFLGVLFGVLLINFARYFLTSGTLFYLYYVKHRSGHAKLVNALPTRAMVVEEIKVSSRAIAAASVVNALMGVAILRGWTELYIPILQHDIWYIPVSFMLLAVTHDFFHYWMHRTCHQIKWLYRRMHAVHHRFQNPTPFCDWAMHPIDGILNSIYPMIFAFFIPIHVYVFFFYVSFLLIMIALGHLGYEIFPPRSSKTLFPTWMGRVQMHSLHHTRVHCNYGLYTNLWDSLWKTEVISDLGLSPPQKTRDLRDIPHRSSF